LASPGAPVVRPVGALYLTARRSEASRAHLSPAGRKVGGASLRFQGVLHPHAPRRFRLRFPAPRGRVRKCRRGSCSESGGLKKRRVVLSATLDRSSPAAHSNQFSIVVLGRCSRKNCMKWTTHCPSLLTSSSVAGHTKWPDIPIRPLSPLAGAFQVARVQRSLQTPDRATA
jgi:hypothetical protein